mmetsp:Transcript_37502/g.105893  ORF Transcript_37502/g.105893 Transcript_37502/m.105893 type:complete len:492 (-) Transcript_37502:40-1515(-)
MAGHTLTSKIKFEDVIKQVAALVKPDWFPVILSLEVHCSHELQVEMARILRAELGDMLFAPTGPGARPDQLPSPADLRGRVLCKGPWKEIDTDDEDDAAMTPEAEAAAEQGVGAHLGKRLLTSPRVAEQLSTSLRLGGSRGRKSSDNGAATGPLDTVPSDQSQPLSFSGKVPAPPRTEKKKVVAHELSEVIFLGNGKRKDLAECWKGGSSWPEGFPANQMCSFSESVVAVVGDDCRREWTTYNTRNLSRTYPAGLRVDSSNYNPLPAWALGCQIVALNVQSLDSPIRYNNSVFAMNGGCGYVLKPPSLRDLAQQQSPASASTSPERALWPSASGSLGCLELSIKVVCATRVPSDQKKALLHSTVDPYVYLKLIEPEGTKQKFKTPTVSNSVSPVFNFHASFVIRHPELSFLEMKLKDDDAGNDFTIGTFVAPVELYREGLRCIPLRDKKYNQQIDSSILVEVKWVTSAASAAAARASAANKSLSLPPPAVV